MSKKSVGTAYLLWAFSAFGVLGFHRFYLGKVGTGFLWIITGGLAFVGAIVDLFRIPKMVHDYNNPSQPGININIENKPTNINTNVNKQEEQEEQE